MFQCVKDFNNNSPNVADSRGTQPDVVGKSNFLQEFVYFSHLVANTPFYFNPIEFNIELNVLAWSFGVQNFI